jgi:hypothetical protein
MPSGPQGLALVEKATVQIVAQGTFSEPSGQAVTVAGAGSGFLISDDGLVVTNNHVVTGAATLNVFVPDRREPVNAGVVATSECADLAIIQLPGDRSYLDVAHRCADFYVVSTPDGVPPNDWDEPDPDWPYESSAGAAAAGELWGLARLTDDSGCRAVYRDMALKIMDRLVAPEFLASDTPHGEGILRHGTYHERNGLGVDESVMFGDYLFVEGSR